MNLHHLMLKYGSDKATHGFCEFYHNFFKSVRLEVKSVLEIGVADGASIRAWLDYFPNAHVWGMDAKDGEVGRYGNRDSWPRILERTAFCEGDQANRAHLEELIAHKISPPAHQWDVVIDDGGHTMEQQQVSLAVLFPHTRMFYVVEDLHTSFMDEITIYNPNGPDRSYPTGAVCGPTTHELLVALKDGKGMAGGGLSMQDSIALLQAAPTVHIFDRDGDHKHMTAILEVSQ